MTCLKLNNDYYEALARDKKLQQRTRRKSSSLSYYACFEQESLENQSPVYSDFLTIRFSGSYSLSSGTRTYDSKTAKWLSRDSIAEQGGYNLYGFIGNDGVNLIDYLGFEDYMPPPGTSIGMTPGGSVYWEETGKVIEHIGGDLELIWTDGILYEQDGDDCIKVFVRQQWVRRYDDYKEVVTYSLAGADLSAYVLGMLFSWLPSIPGSTKTEDFLLPRRYGRWHKVGDEDILNKKRINCATCPPNAPPPMPNK